jgi:hypothetical protein
LEVAMRILLPGFLLVVVGCANGPVYTHSCQLGQACLDYEEAQVSIGSSLCSSISGVFRSMPCATSGRVAACTITCGTGEDVFFQRINTYPPIEVSDAQRQCVPTDDDDLCVYDFERL